MIVLIASVAVALLVSSLCSLLEAALLSLTPSQLAQIRQRNVAMGDVCRRLKYEIEKPIAVILIVNTAAHTFGASVAGAQFNELYGARWLGAFTLVFTLMMVQYTEILPKTLGVRYNRKIMCCSARPLSLMIAVMMPLIVLIRWFNRPFELSEAKNSVSAADEISALAALARSNRQISRRQERIIKVAPMLSQKRAEQIMLPSENISFLSSRQTLTEAINWVGMDFHTRYPVCRGSNRDQVLGYVNFKEVVATYRANPEHGKLMDILRPISFAAPGESAAELLERFVSRQCHMAVVRGSRGRTLGLVTLEDIVEELLGDLDDEFDPLPRTFYSLGGAIWVVGGGVPLTLLARRTWLALPRRTEPVAIWFAGRLKRMPRIGDTLKHNNAEFHVHKVRRGRVLEFGVRQIV